MSRCRARRVGAWPEGCGDGGSSSSSSSRCRCSTSSSRQVIDKAMMMEWERVKKEARKALGLDWYKRMKQLERERWARVARV